MEVKVTITRTYVVSQVMDRPFMKFGTFRKSREKLGLSVERKCFSCGHKFTDDEDTFLVFFNNTHNRLFCRECKEKALRELKNE